MSELNIVLTGFMLSGKTTVGELIAAMTGRELIDTDALIVERAGKPVSEIFDTQGEAAFREYERDAVAAATRGRGLVIALGGGECEAGRDRLPPGRHATTGR
jgi:shikimate kinase